MKKRFDTYEYIDDLGKELIIEFEKAGKTTHPHSVGEGREKSAIRKLRNILPEGVGIGSGFIIDTFGGVSSQCDIIIYEKDFCLKFNSEDEKNCYYNCESVIAVGEVKSDLDSKALIDSIKKLKKIRNLKRKTENNNSFRSYLSKQTIIGTEKEKYDQRNKPFDQIFTFILCNNFIIKHQSIINIINDNCEKYEYPNIITSINGEHIGYAKQGEKCVQRVISSLYGDSFAYNNENSPFRYLLDLIFSFIQCGRSVRYNPIYYIYKNEEYNIRMYPFEDVN